MDSPAKTQDAFSPPRSTVAEREGNKRVSPTNICVQVQSNMCHFVKLLLGVLRMRCSLHVVILRTSSKIKTRLFLEEEMTERRQWPMPHATSHRVPFLALPLAPSI